MRVLADGAWLMCPRILLSQSAMEAYDIMQTTHTSVTNATSGFKERRWAQRTPSAIEVGIKMANGNWQRCQVVNLSLAGMYLDFPAADLIPEDILTLKFTLDIDGLLKHYFEKVTVKHVSENGIAVAFENFTNSHFVILQKLLHLAYCQNNQINSIQAQETNLSTPIYSLRHY